MTFSPRRFAAMARKEFIHVARDPRSLMLAFAIPVTMLLLFGFALTLDVNDIPTAVLDLSRSAAGRDYLSRFEGSGFFRFSAFEENYRGIEKALDERRALVALVIPADFARKTAAGRPVKVQLIADGSDPNTATIATGYASFISAAWSKDATVERVRRMGGRTGPDPIDARPRVWFNPSMESRNAIIPGLIAVIMMVIAALLASLTVSREWERGTMEMLVSTPVRGAEVIAGKMAPYFVVGMADVAAAVSMGELVFDVPLRGNGALVFAVSALFLAGALGMGMVISVFTRSQLVSNQLAMVLTYLPAFLLSGFVFPVANMPAVIQAATRLIPARYFIAILRDIYLKGLGIEAIALETTLLAVFAAAAAAMSVAGFRKRIG